MTKHTKGWHYKQGEAGLIFDENGDIVCDMMPCEENKTELANANLAVMAPDMYAMLELVKQHINNDSIEDFLYHYKELDSLLAKARGEL